MNYYFNVHVKIVATKITYQYHSPLVFCPREKI